MASKEYQTKQNTSNNLDIKTQYSSPQKRPTSSHVQKDRLQLIGDRLGKALAMSPHKISVRNVTPSDGDNSGREI